MSLNLGLSIALTVVGLIGIGLLISYFLFGLSNTDTAHENMAQLKAMKRDRLDLRPRYFTAVDLALAAGLVAFLCAVAIGWL